MTNPNTGATGMLTLPSGFVLDHVAAAAHVLQPAHVKGVVSSRGLEEGAKKFPLRQKDAGVTLSFDTDGFVAALNTGLANSTAGYAMQLRHQGRAIASGQVNWAKRPSDGSESWTPTVRMHIASCSKLVTAIAMTRALNAHSLPPATTKIIDYLPTYWSKGQNVDKITFADLMTHKSGFRVSGSDMSFPTMKALIASGVSPTNHGVYSYQNTNFGICRILLPVLNGTIAASTHFASGEDQIWDFVTINAYATYVNQHLFQPAGVSGPTLTHPNPDALAYAFPPTAGWDSGDLTAESGGAGWHMSVDDLLDVMGCFRRQNKIMSTSEAQTLLDQGFGIDLIQATHLGTLYNKNGLWQSGSGQTEQSLAYFLPRDMELVVLANSPIGAPGQSFRDVVTQIYLDHIKPEISVGGWIARHGLTGEKYQEAFNDYVGNHGMQLVDVTGYGSAAPLYAAIWEKSASQAPWQARHGLSAADYQTIFDQLTAEGYAPHVVNGYATTAGPRFACIFRKDGAGAGAWTARHGLSAAQYQTTFDQLTADGYALDWVSGYFDGTRDLYAAIWRKIRDVPAWQARHGLTSAEYQSFFNTVTADGYKPVVVCGYSDGTQDRYAAIFRRIAGGANWQARHGLSPAQYQTTFDQLVGEGYRLEQVNAYSVRGSDHIAAIWTK